MASASNEIESESGTIRVGSQRIWAVFGLMFSGLAVFLCGWTLVHDWYKPNAVLLMPLGVLLFSWLTWLMTLRLYSNYRTEIGPVGITVPGPTFKPKLIQWDDIDLIFPFHIRLNGYTGIKLRNLKNLILQYSDDETRIMLRRNLLLGWMARTRAPVAMSQSGAKEGIVATGVTDNLENYFASRRLAYGCDVIIAGIDRDRNAEDFTTYLEGFRVRYSTLAVSSRQTESAHA